MKLGFILSCLILIVISAVLLVTIPAKSDDPEYVFKNINPTMKLIAEKSLHGGFTSRKVYYCSVKNGKPDIKNKRMAYQAIFNSNAKIIELQQLSFDGVLDYKLKYKYDGNGKLTDIYTYNSDDILNSQYVYRYDAEGKKTKEAYYKGGSMYFEFIYKYDNKGILTENCGYLIDGSFTGKETFKHDSNGNNTQSCAYGSNGSLIKKRTFSYDSKGHKTQCCAYGCNASLLSKETFDYDSNGHKTQYCAYGNDGVSVQYKEIRKYDKYGNVIEVNTFNNMNELTSCIIVEYK